jgi:cobalt-zinc-cadmium efflux system outer membrane protein
MLRNFILILFFSFIDHSNVNAQTKSDTLHVKLPDAEKIFLDSNLLLLAQQYNIDANKALIIQARLIPNPNFSISHGLYSGTLKQFFPTGNNDETAAGLSQLILLAGKRNKQIKIAQANTALSEFQFFDLIRTLKYALRTDFYNIYYLQRSAKVYDEEISSLQQVVTAFEEQQGKGYIAEKEVVRIKAQMYSLQSEYNDLQNQINDLQSEMRLLLQVKHDEYIDPLIDSASMADLSPAKYPLTALLDSAYQNRTDLLIAKTNTNINRLNYDYQKALAVPDVTLSLGYDEQGSFLTNFYSIGASIDLPFFNRNQGNIKSARSMIDLSEASQKSTEATVENNVSRSLQKAYSEDKLYQNIDARFSNDFDRLMHEVLINYQKRNISLLDFLDFYDSYKQNILQINNIKFGRVSAFEDINYYTGTSFFNQ